MTLYAIKVDEPRPIFIFFACTNTNFLSKGHILFNWTTCRRICDNVCVGLYKHSLNSLQQFDLGIRGYISRLYSRISNSLVLLWVCDPERGETSSCRLQYKTNPRTALACGGGCWRGSRWSLRFLGEFHSNLSLLIYNENIIKVFLPTLVLWCKVDLYEPE